MESDKYQQGCGDNGIFCVVGRKNYTATMENCIGALPEIKIELPYDPAILPLSIYLKEIKSLS